ncbi:MAG: Stk1 family PASTA domain-containing Ser/Thr kinase [Actinomycetota bacterium]
MSEQGPTVFNGRYELLRHIARGGMADVYLARDELLGREVALKVLFPEFANDPNFVERFRREAQAAANLNHPNIVGIYDWGQERGTYYIVMEHVSGRSMSDVLRSTGPLNADRAAEIAADVAGALSTAHAAGLVHRDIKLGNILVSDAGDVKVADFGIATALVSGGEAALTQHGSVMGTATYFSPEQAQGKALDGRSDLYSLGVVLYEMLAGVPPFQAETPVAVAYKHVQERPQALTDRGVQVAPSLQAITMKLLAKNPANRYPTADDLRSDLRRYLAGAHKIPGKGAAAAGAAGAAAASAAPAAAAAEVAPTPVEPTPAPAAPPVDATTAQPVTPAQPVAVPAAAAQPMPQQYVDPNQAAMAQAGYGGGGGYYYEEPPRGGGMWRNVALVGSLAVLIIILGFLFARFWDALGGDSDGDADNDDVEVELVDVPSVDGLEVDDARALLLEANLNFEVEFEPNNDIPVNEVIAQDPPSGQRVEPGAVITLRVSSGTEDTVPNVIGESQESATAILQGSGYTVTVTPTTSPQEAGTVIGQFPAAGVAHPPGDSVEISVSSGPEVVPVPDVEGLDLVAAINAINAAGFNVDQTQLEEASEEIEEGRVIRTNPEANTLLADGSLISIVVSTGLPMVEVPLVTDLFADTAITTLRNQGLEVVTLFETVPEGSVSIGRVISQSPSAFEEVEVGTTITITVGEAPPQTTTTTTTTTTTVPEETTTTTEDPGDE